MKKRVKQYLDASGNVCLPPIPVDAISRAMKLVSEFRSTLPPTTSMEYWKDLIVLSADLTNLKAQITKINNANHGVCSDFDVISSMIRNGGGFHKALGKAAQIADSQNLKIIKESWPTEWHYFASISGRCK